MVDIKQLQELSNVFSAVMGRIFLQSTVNEEGPGADLTLQQRKVLFALEFHGPLKMSDLARQIGVTMPAGTLIVDKMVKANLVKRDFDESDRRVVRIEMSSEGREAVLHCVGLQQRCFEGILSKLTPEKRDALLESFKQIHNLLDEINRSDSDHDKKSEQ